MTQASRRAAWRGSPSPASALRRHARDGDGGAMSMIRGLLALDLLASLAGPTVEARAFAATRACPMPEDRISWSRTPAASAAR